MADSFFGFDTSFQNLNDDEGGGEPSEDEYDALNDETFGQDSDELDWEVEHEQLAEQLESRRRHHAHVDDDNLQLEASLSKLVLDEPEPAHLSLGSSVWRHDLSFPTPAAPTPVPPLKNVCTVEELERQLRQGQAQQQLQHQQHQQPPFPAQNYYQQRFPTMILQRPPGLQAPVPLPFAPQPPIGHNINQMSAPLNKIVGQTGQMSQMVQGNQTMQNHMMQNVNSLGQNMSQLTQNANQLGQNMNQVGQTINQMAHNNPFMQNNQLNPQFQNNHMGQSMMNQMQQNVQNVHQMSQSNQMLQNQMGQNMSQMDQTMAQMSQSMNQMNQMNQINQSINPMGQNMNQMLSNGSQYGPGINQFSHMLGQSRIPPPPGMGMQRQNFSPSMNQFNPNFRGPMTTNKSTEQQTQINQNMVMNQHLKNQPLINQKIVKPLVNSQQLNQQNPQQVNSQQLANQQMNAQHKNSQQMNLQQISSQQMNSHHMNSQHMNSQQMNSQQMSSQQMNSQQMNSQQMNSQQMNSQQMNSQQMNASINSQPMNSHTNSQQTNMKQMNSKPANTQQMNMHHISPQLNSPQNKGNQSALKPVANQRNEKVQKSRVYNNTSTKVMTPQNLAKFLLQSTYPGLPYNSLHNASHHPMLNRGAVFTNTQFMNNHPMFNNQRSNGTYNNVNRHMMNGDDSGAGGSGGAVGAGGEVDEYAGLMTAREKQWLINIQMLQLNTGTPYIHDFYYTVFLERQANKEKEGIKEAHKANQQNHPFYSGGVKQEQGRERERERERHNSHRHNSSSEEAAPRQYVPAQFENSLGKLQCGSVTAPRKIIDVEVVSGEPASASARTSRAPSVASTTNPAEVPREVRRTKQVLLDIEAMYVTLLRLEELNDPLAIANALILKEREEKQKQLEAAQKEAMENEAEDESNLFLKNIESVQRRPKQDSPKSDCVDKRQVVSLAVSQKPAPVKNLLDEDREELLGRLFAALLHADRLPQVLAVRKGRALVARFVSRAPCGHVRMRALWSRVLRALPHAARRDDGGLAALVPHYRRYIQNTTGWSAVLESCGILAETVDPARTPHALTSPLTLGCVCAMLEKAATLVNTPEATSSERQWHKFLKSLARALRQCSLGALGALAVARPPQPLPAAALLQHLHQLDSRTTVEILQRGRTAADLAHLTKADVSDLLLAHLC